MGNLPVYHSDFAVVAQIKPGHIFAPQADRQRAMHLSAGSTQLGRLVLQAMPCPYGIMENEDSDASAGFCSQGNGKALAGLIITVDVIQQMD